MPKDYKKEEQEKKSAPKKEYKSLKLSMPLYNFYDKLRQRYPEWGFSLATQLILHVLQRYAMEQIEKDHSLAKFQKVEDISLETKIESIIGFKLHDLEGIKSNIEPEVIKYIIRSCFFKKKVLILIEQGITHLKNAIINFFDFIFHKTFIHNIFILNKGDYEKNKVLYENYIILKTYKDKKEDWKNIFDTNDLNIEDGIVNKFYKEVDLLTGLIELRDKIREIYKVTHKLFEYNESLESPKPLSPKKVIKDLKESTSLDVKNNFNFLMEVTRNYFITDITSVPDKLAELLTEMWGV